MCVGNKNAATAPQRASAKSAQQRKFPALPKFLRGLTIQVPLGYFVAPYDVVELFFNVSL